MHSSCTGLIIQRWLYRALQHIGVRPRVHPTASSARSSVSRFHESGYVHTREVLRSSHTGPIIQRRLHRAHLHIGVRHLRRSWLGRRRSLPGPRARQPRHPLGGRQVETPRVPLHPTVSSIRTVVDESVSRETGYIHTGVVRRAMLNIASNVWYLLYNDLSFSIVYSCSFLLYLPFLYIALYFV